MYKVLFITFGCKVNHYETECMKETFRSRKWEVVGEDCDTDAVVINSCTVTASGDSRVLAALRKARARYPEAVIALTGCYPQADPEGASKLMDADLVCGTKDRGRTCELIEELIADRKRTVLLSAHEKGELFEPMKCTHYEDNTRAFVKIQDGCDRFCSYCVIPIARGRVRSKPITDIKSEAEALAKAGYIEVVLVGINLSAYGKDTGESFASAVAAACENEGIKRVRLGSLEPDHITDSVISELSKLPKLCPQFHISLQSGCDKTLKRMNRHYTVDEYLELCNKLRKAFPDCTLTTDVMVGFAGETEQDFDDTMAFVRKVGFEKVHIFPYSVREGTRAAEFDGQVEKSVKEKRVSLLMELTDKIRAEFLSAQVGKTVEIIPETKQGSYIFGYTANYTPVLVKNKALEFGSLVKVKIISADSEYCYAE